MLEMEIILPRADLRSALDVILYGADIPTHRSSGEDDARFEIKSNEEVYSLSQQNGYFLWSPNCLYEISITSDEVAIFAMSSEVRVIEKLVADMAELEISFGYACASGEREHRNKISRKMDYGVHEAWVGRDRSKYMPGVYWMTILPVVMQQSLGVPVDALREIALDLSLLSNRNWLVKLYDAPDHWRLEASRIDVWCAHTSGLFHKALADKELGGARNFIEASSALTRWS